MQIYKESQNVLCKSTTEAFILLNFQDYATKESLIQFCPNFCDDRKVIYTYCKANQPDYVPAFGAEVQSSRCCDKKGCHCVCHFDCGTMETKAEQIKVRLH